MSKLIYLALTMLAILSAIAIGSLLFTPGETDEHIQQDISNMNKNLETYEVVYAPIECFFNETHYNVSCVDDYDALVSNDESGGEQ